MSIRLSDATITELRSLADAVGKARQDSNANRPDAYGFRGDGLKVHQDGAFAEAVAAYQLLGRLVPTNIRWDGRWVPTAASYWNAFLSDGNYQGVPDIFPGFQVRSTTRPKGRLLLHPKDQDNQIFILVRVPESGAEVVGWILGTDGKKEEYWEELNPGRPCFVVPNERLHGFSD